MRIGILGSGHIGRTLAALWVWAGHEVALSNTRGPDTLREVVEDLGERAHAMTAADAAAFGGVVVLAVPFIRYRDLPVEQLASKIVIDTSNYYPDRDGHFDELDSGESTSSEVIAAALPGARVVKAINTMYWERLRAAGQPHGSHGRLAIPIAGDDAEAKSVVSQLLDEIGFDPVDTGSLRDGGRRQQPGSAIYNVPLTRAGIEQRLDAASKGS
jgi:8-hydroxy-5-deazaflavin:NADPH oxidoreductase